MSTLKLPCSCLCLGIVAEVVARNVASHTRPWVAFRQFDAVAELLPDSDAVLCREVISHLSFADGLKLVDNIKRHAKWLIMISDGAIWFDSDIPLSDLRTLNLQRPPYRIPEPEYVS